MLERDQLTLTNSMLNYIHLYSVIFSGYWNGYFILKNYFIIHQTVNHSMEFVNRTNNVHINNIEGNWSGIKRSICFRCRHSLISKFIYYVSCYLEIILQALLDI